MAVESDQDLESYLTDWGETWLFRGTTFTAEFQQLPAETFNARGTAPSILFETSALTPVLAADDVIVRQSTGAPYKVADVYEDDAAGPEPMSRAILFEA